MARRNLGSCCVCIPSEPGVATICVLFFLIGLWDFVAFFLDDIRLQFNGYYPPTTKLEVSTGSLHLVFALLGFLGVLDANPGYVRLFARFLLFHCLCYSVVFGFDYFTLLHKCVPQDSVRLDEFNPAIDAVARKGACGWTRRSYLIGFVLSLALRLYWWSVVDSFSRKIAKRVPDLIRFRTKAGEPDVLDGVLVEVDDEHPADFFDEDDLEAQALREQE